MNVLNILKNTLNEERSIPKGKKHLLLLDIDDTLLKAKNNMKIYHTPTGRALSPEEYAQENVSTPELKKQYDYRDFRDKKKVYESIVKGAPYINNLKVLDDFYNAGADIGILTARGCEDVVYKAIKTFLRVRDKNGKLIKPELPRERVHGVNDDDKHYPGGTDAEKKKNVIRNYYDKYDYITLFDDDVKNIKNALDLKKTDPKAQKKVRTINAKKNRGEASAPVEEEVISETRRHSGSDDMLMAANNGDYEKAIILYFNENKDSSKYAGKKDAASVLRLMINHGIPRFFLVREKSGEILEGVTQKLKEWGLSHISKLADKLEYTGNPDYIAPKKSLRKKFMAKSLDELQNIIDNARGDGYIFKDQPKEGHTAKDGDFYYIYGSVKPRINESTNMLQTLLNEMASKDVDANIRKNINDGNYKQALIDYFNKVKGGKAYEKYGDDLGAIYDQVRRYGMMRAFGAEERDGKVPSGTAKILSRVAEQNRKEILSSLGFDADAPSVGTKALKEKLAEKKAKNNSSEIPTDDLAKIEKRINDYEERIKNIKDYALTGESIKPFIVDIKRNGPNGTDKYAKKQRLSGFDIDLPEASETERRLVPIMKWRKNTVPEFIQKAALNNLDGDAKRNLDKAETLGELYYEATKNKIFADYLVRYLNNIVEGFKDFKRNNKENLTLDELKTEVDFPYKKFVEFEKWAKNTKISADKEESEKPIRKRADVKVPEEVSKVRREYISFLNELDKAIAEGKVFEFLEVPNNYGVAYGALNQAVEEEPFDQKLIKYWETGRHTSINELSPRLKRIFNERKDESMDIDFAKKYKELSQKLARARAKALMAKKMESEKIFKEASAELEECAKEIINVVIDRLIALDILDASFGSALLYSSDPKEKAARLAKYEKIKAEAIKKDPSLAFNPKSDKYKKYYDPSGEEAEKIEKAKDEAKAAQESLDKMYNAISASLDKLTFNELLGKKLVPVKGVNIAQKRYTDEEVKELYDTLQQGGDEKLYELLATDKFRALRKSK